MSDFPGVPLEVAEVLSPVVPPEKRDARLRWFELSLVLLVAFAGPLANALFLLHSGPAGMPHIPNARWLIGLMQEITSLLLLGYVLSRRGLGFGNIGLRWSLSDVGSGLLLAGVAFAVYVIGSLLVHLFYWQIYGSFAPQTSGKDFFAHPGLAVIPFTLVNPFGEELIVRAYLMTEVRELTGSSMLAVAVSVLVQSSYHLYYGWAGAISLSFMFLTFAIYYVRSRKALPVVVAHAAFDIYAVLRLW
jgi:membrane protease YdiL (CAAX protease family)